MPNAARLEPGSVFLAHFAEEVFAYLLRSAGLSSSQLVQLVAETSFLGLSDTPDSYTDSTGLPVVSSGEGVVFEPLGTAGIADDAVTAVQIDPSVAPAVHVRFLSEQDDSSDVDTTLLAVGDLILTAIPAGSTFNGVLSWLGEGLGFGRWTLDAQKMRLVNVTEGTHAGELWRLTSLGAVGSDVLEYVEMKDDSAITIATDDTAEDTLQAWALAGDHGLETYQNEGTLVVRGEWRVDLVADANVTLSGSGTIDGTTLATGMLVLAPNQTTGADRDVFVVNTAGAWPRFGLRVTSGQLIRVKRGTRYAGTLWELMTTAAITRGTTTLLWWRTDGRLAIYPGIDGAMTLPDNLGRLYVPAPLLTTIRVYTLPASPMPGQEIIFQFTSTGTAGLQIARNGTQTINGGTANYAITLTNYRRAVAIYNDLTNAWLINSYPL